MINLIVGRHLRLHSMGFTREDVRLWNVSKEGALDSPALRNTLLGVALAPAFVRCQEDGLGFDKSRSSSARLCAKEPRRQGNLDDEPNLRRRQATLV